MPCSGCSALHGVNHNKKKLNLRLTELWLKYGVGPKVRFLPLHILIASLDQNLLDVLLKVHILTGCGVTSKIGTKFAALKSDRHM